MTNAPPNLTNSAAATNEIQLEDDILGIQPPVDVPTGWEWLLYTLTAAVLLGLAIFLTRRLLRRFHVIKPPPIPYVEPHTVARRRLEAALRLIDDPYRFCSAVSTALRSYFEGRFSIHAPDRTTDEFLDELRSSTALTERQQELVGEFLAQCDLVKFARDQPARSELEKMQRFALGLVEETMPGSGAPVAADARQNAEVSA